MGGRFRIVLAVSLTALLFDGIVALTIVRARHWMRIGYAGVNYLQIVEPNQERVFGLHGGQVVLAFPDGPGERAGIRRADEIVDIEGIPITDSARLRALDGRVRSGDTVRYHIRRGAASLSVPVRFESPFRNVFLILNWIVNTIVALAFITVGFVVFSRQPDDRRARVFCAMVLFGALALLTTSLAALDASTMRGIVADPATEGFTLILVPLFLFGFLPLTLHLALVFPHERPVLRTSPSVLRWIYVIPAAALLLWIALVVVAIWGISERFSRNPDLLPEIAAIVFAVAGIGALLHLMKRGRSDGWKTALLSRPVESTTAGIGVLIAAGAALHSLHLKIPAAIVFIAAGLGPFLSVMAYPVLACLALVRSYREAGLEERRQIKWPVWGTFIALSVKILFGVAEYGTMFALMFGERDIATFMRYAQIGHLIPTLVYLLIPISFAVAILQYRLMNIDVIIKKTVAYAILSGMIVFIYLVLVGGLGTMLVRVAGLRNQTMVIASTLVVALLFVPLRNRLQYLVDHNLFRQKYDYPEALRVIAAESLRAVDVSAFLAFAAETLQQALQNRSVAIFERRDNDFLATAKIGLPDSILGSLRMDRSDAEPIDRPLHPSRRPLPDGAAEALRRVDASLVVPVRTNGVQHALVALGSKLSGREFDIEDADFLSSAADQIGLTIERIRLQGEEADFQQARLMQQALLPASAPQMDGVEVSGTWKPARAVGGDYYDLLELSPTQLAVCIGDVAGKGMPAALMMSALRAAVRASAAPGIAPAALCERVRRVIVQTLAGGRFVTFFFGMIDTEARRISYCNAGHNPPVLVRTDGAAIRLDKGGAALSRLFSGTPFQEGEEALFEGDRLVLFTDGVSEARNQHGDDYGEERLEQIIAAHRHSRARDLVTTIADSVSAWSGGRIDDDLTLVAVAVG